MKRVHNDSIAAKKICIRFSYLRPQESGNSPQQSTTIHNSSQHRSARANNSRQYLKLTTFYKKIVYTSRFVRVILLGGPCYPLRLRAPED